MKTGKLLIGILSGAAAGVAAGLLLAPKKGSDTRQRIKDKSNEYVTGSKNKINGFVDDVSHTFDSVKTKAMGKSKKLQAEMDGDEKIIY